MMLGLDNLCIFMLRKDIPLNGAMEGDSIVSDFGMERVLEIDYNLGDKIVLISRVQEDSKGIVKRTMALESGYPTSLNAMNIDVIYRGQNDYDKCEKILGAEK